MQINVIEVPSNWLEQLVEYAELASKDKNFTPYLIGYASSGRIILNLKGASDARISKIHTRV